MWLCCKALLMFWFPTNTSMWKAYVPYVFGFACLVNICLAYGLEPSTCEAEMKAAAPSVQNVLNMLQISLRNEKSVGRVRAVLEVCERMVGNSLEHLDSSIRKMQTYSVAESVRDGNDIWTWMSAAVTSHSTCIDELESLGSSDLSQSGSSDLSQLVQTTKGVHSQIETSLALFATMHQLSLQSVQSVHARKLLFVHTTPTSVHDPSLPYQLHDGLPDWMPLERRRHLLQTASADIVVAQDGSGRFSKIQDAVNNASPGNVIYVKSGTYYETLVVPSSKYNLVITGDGIGKTIITGSKYFAQTGNTFKTQTVDIQANGFIGKYLTIQNTASADKHQALAVLVSADKVAFYKCSFDAYQDTVCTFTNRQFYRECQVTGSVDFIFGNAAAVFQQCSIYAKHRAGHERTTITAQGRTSKYQNTGLSFHQCSVDGALPKTFLGRPWQDYSRVVFMKCALGSAIDPAGWFGWKGASYRSSTVYYGEYQNTGAGADRSNRVSWSKELSMDEALQFTVGSFIGGGQWLGVPYVSSL